MSRPLAPTWLISLALVGCASTPDPTEPQVDSELVSQPSTEAPPTPLARLTNQEFLHSLEHTLELPRGTLQQSPAAEALPSEPEVQGLTNDAANQALTQLGVSGLERMATVAADAYLQGTSTVDDVVALLGCDSADDLDACLQAGGEDLVARAYRRPATADDAQVVRTVLDAIGTVLEEEGQAPDTYEAVALVVRSLVRYIALSPEFLLLMETPGDEAPEGQPSLLSSHQIATRLAYFLSEGPPDDLLLGEADAGGLRSAEERAAHVQRLLGDAESRTAFAVALVGWLGVAAESVEPADYAALVAFVSQWLESEEPVGQLYTGGIEVLHADDTTSTEPFGVLGSRAFVAAHTNHPTPSFITRGVFVVEDVLCDILPEGLPDEAVEDSPDSAVEVFQQHARQPCASCHTIFDNYGAAFQRFEPETLTYDPSRTPFGTQFELSPIGDVSGQVAGVADLSETLATSKQAPTCLARLLYRHALRRHVDALGEDRALVQRLTDQWLDTTDTSLRSLVETIVASDEFVTFYP
ncbi:MAG: DUF1592 domain-containing protein [Myxococcales bacterium]|nr:DUF1592 domain-containing protein [Myxococcales bacterium]